MDDPKMLLSGQQLTLLALCRPKGSALFLLAREAQRPDGLSRLLSGEITETSDEARKARRVLRDSLERLDELRDEVSQSVQRAFQVGARLTTVLDSEYPLNLRAIYDLPPFLFFRGSLESNDIQAVAVVGTRHPTEEGFARADHYAKALAGRDVTVLSGLAKGIDSQAHRSTLEAKGRTVAVMGTGILRIYPAENETLAEEIVSSGGALVSQFFPDSPPGQWSFPLRNRVMSGLGQGTVVVEASKTSGARMQARLAIEHGKRVFLPKQLVETYDWARSYAKRPGALVVNGPDEVLSHLKPLDVIRERDARREQLSLLE